MTVHVPPPTRRVNDDGITDAHDATTARYGACTAKPAAPRAALIVYGLVLIMIMIFGDNVLEVRKVFYEII